MRRCSIITISPDILWTKTRDKFICGDQTALHYNNLTWHLLMTALHYNNLTWHSLNRDPRWVYRRRSDGAPLWPFPPPVFAARPWPPRTSAPDPSVSLPACWSHCWFSPVPSWLGSSSSLVLPPKIQYTNSETDVWLTFRCSLHHL